jgi:hypothetical protein
MIFSSLMIIPLFYGVKFLTSSDKAKFVILLYGLTPLFINYTKFLWNPNFQLSLLPLLFLFLGLYKKQTKNYWLILSGIWFGLILQFHYQLIIGGILLLFYMYFHLKLSGSKIMLFLLGSIIGFLPIIIYELQHNFPNLKTLLFYSQNFKSFNNSNSGIFKNQHYFLSVSLITAIIIVSFLKRLSTKIIYTAAGLLLVMDLFLYIPKPTHGFGMAENWNYLDEQKAFEIIKNENLKGYNITNLNYDTLATVQKYLQKKENMDKNLTDYWETDKMFVISPNTKNINTDPTYEIQVVRPFEIIHTWPLNANNTLFLLKRM